MNSYCECGFGLGMVGMVQVNEIWLSTCFNTNAHAHSRLVKIDGLRKAHKRVGNRTLHESFLSDSLRPAHSMPSLDHSQVQCSSLVLRNNG